MRTMKMLELLKAKSWGVLLAALSTVALSCGSGKIHSPFHQGTGSSGKYSMDAGSQEYRNVFGSIASEILGPQVMGGWVVALIDVDGISRVAEIDAAGLFTLRMVDVNQAHTVVLLSPDYIIQATLNLPEAPNFSPRSFLRFRDKHDLRLYAKGDEIRLAEPDAFDFVHPRGVARGTSLNRNRDADGDGIPNFTDPDIDDDGLVNVIDQDDDGDGLLDVFDLDANDNLISDSNEQNSNQHFSVGLKHIVISQRKVPHHSGFRSDHSLFIQTELRDVDPRLKSVQIRGAPKVFVGSEIETIDDGGLPVRANWNRLLGDDGVTSDGRANDGIYGATIHLNNDLVPRANEMIFIQLRYGPDDNPWYREFPYTFPEFEMGDVSAQYDSNAKTIVKVQEVGKDPPFGDHMTYRWIVVITDSNGQIISTSDPIPGETNTYPIPTNRLIDGESYSFKVVGQPLPKVAGETTHTVESPVTTFVYNE